ncbi:calcium/calmodulin-dependent protein kinase type IV-like [Ruditapes philippinarum]|uniref:calcium/calmodulin-dependent protein kinase type IV-like n=1 Tax=Ruditapes philippinarum TaxID=129788 RepID=UPI00295C1C50|nr:calcium/calmodulin-dependent protein kinase type IV-like [Ruditapes philippinarum]
MSIKNGPHLPHYHNAIKSTNDSAVYTPSTSIISDPLTDKYIVGENIGRGKFAVVRKCTNKKTGEVLAAKFIKKRRRGKSCREEILREVVMLEMALDHPRLVNLKEVYETQQELILITEYCAGGELFTECILEEKFNEADVRLLMSQILEGLVYLHEKNIVHLDLKPQNILLTDEFPKGSVKICDLGFACLVNTGEDIRDIIGTPDYVAPEVLNYDTLGLYTDMWSLGVLTYVMLTTCSPFAAEDKQMTFSNITSVNLDFPEDLFGDISQAAQDFIQKLLIADPSERMTAKECFNHEWLAGYVGSSTKPLTIGYDETVDHKTGENIESIEHLNDPDKRISDSKEGELDNEIESKVKDQFRGKIENQTSEMSVTDDKEDTKLDNEIENKVTDSFRGKIENQTSEMSFTEERDDEGIFVDPESDLSSHETNISDKLSEDPYQEGNVTHKQNLNANYVEPSNDEIRNICTVNNVSSCDVTPDTDSSMCLTESRQQEVDSGMATNSEPLDISGRTSVELEPDTELNSEPNNDIEMLNKSCIENDIKDEVGNVSERTENNDSNKTGLSSDGNREQNIVNSEDADTAMDVEMLDTCDIREPLPVNVTNDANNHTPDKQHSKGEESWSNVSVEVNAPKQEALTKDPATSQSNRDTKVRSSVSHIDDSINSMQLGESLKRGMCNESESSGANNPDANNEEYEFVSVSKRVRSYEDSMTSKSPTYSPSIAKSPRIGRHSRFHHQHH